MNRNERLDDHQKFKELAALAQRGTLNDGERLELLRHLRVCVACQQTHDDYALLGTKGMNFLAAVYGSSQETEEWDDRPVRDKLFARIREAEEPKVNGANGNPRPMGRTLLPGTIMARWAAAATAACVLVSVAVGAYRLGTRTFSAAQQPSAPSLGQLQELTSAKQGSDELIGLQKAQLFQVQAQVASAQQEVTRLKDALRLIETRSAALASANSKSEEQLRLVSDQRDKLASQLRDAEQSYQLVRAELTSLRAEHDRVLLRTTSLESKVDELTAAAREEERQLRDSAQFLASDRDIRELMGARKLYIADVFDVDSGSRTRKPFGRVFYTQSKSLIFYAFDLDRQPGVKNASAFQVWGKSDTESGSKTHAMNLGILYMDSESNRRWVLRLDDPKQLAEVDAVFVTVEPQGGSQKPTGKPFLYALLRREANHP